MNMTYNGKLVSEAKPRCYQVMIHKNQLLEKLQAGQAAIGAWCHLSDSLVAEIVGMLDVDYVAVDMQHGSTPQSHIIPMLQAITAARKTPLVRIPHKDYGMAQRLLDAGAEGLIFPMVNNRADADEAVSATRYPPLGDRSFGPLRSQMTLGKDTDEVNAQIMCLVQIETPSAIQNLKEIIQTPGVDGVYIGPADLALSHGLSIQDQEPALDDLFAQVLSACTEYNSIPGIHCFSGESARRAQDRGFAITSVGSDAVWLRSGYSEQLARARGITPVSVGGYY